MNKKIIIINGPNLNLLGQREDDIYGKDSLDTIKNKCEILGKSKKIEITFFQSNNEGEIINKIHEVEKLYDGLVINPAAFTHTSVAIRDALEIYKKPIIELHISNIYRRENFRHKSLISDVVTGGIYGLGSQGYILAIISMEKMMKNEN